MDKSSVFEILCNIVFNSLKKKNLKGHRKIFQMCKRLQLLHYLHCLWIQRLLYLFGTQRKRESMFYVIAAWCDQVSEFLERWDFSVCVNVSFPSSFLLGREEPTIIKFRSKIWEKAPTAKCFLVFWSLQCIWDDIHCLCLSLSDTHTVTHTYAGTHTHTHACKLLTAKNKTKQIN